MQGSDIQMNGNGNGNGADAELEASASGPHEEMEPISREERRHFANVLRSFDEYLPYCLLANNARRNSFLSLPRAHQQLLSDVGKPLPLPRLDTYSSVSSSASTAAATAVEPGQGFRARLEEVDDRIRRNADLLAQIVDESRGFLGEDQSLLDESAAMSGSGAESETPGHSHNHGHHQHGAVLASSSSSGQRRKRRKIRGHDVDKIQSTLKQLVRDWSVEGRDERNAVYAPILEAVEQRYGSIPFEERGEIRILVPGAGLGRLAFDFAAKGFSCQGNEFSFHMLLTSHHILNKTTAPLQHTIYPFVHSSSNWREAGDMLRAISIPDVLPSTLPHTCEFSMVAGEFVEVYSKPQEQKAWNVVATCFFIDTAKNVLRYLETLNNTLPIGGHWINAGPLLWHFENTGNSSTGSSPGADSLSIELTLDEVIDLVAKMGFEIEEQRTLPPAPYTASLNGMLEYNYHPEFFVCRKVRDIAPAPVV
ncbi:N2227-domain-containing protein [Testicularia cyperi]|uniref:carnosine N-methyltransferase n=1 Tax=Testicularia cyperi TaxID=1882483 RepID=A0A317Y0A1_9BASI|nr:N2227-domain-containing protein [Testicularia cyperi]